MYRHDRQMKVGAKIRALRKERNMTINELATAADSDVGNISRLERDLQGFSSQMLEKISIALNVPVSIFFEKEDGAAPDVASASLNNVTEGPEIKGRYPLISWVAAGSWSDITELPLDDATFYPCPVSCSERTFVLRVQGVSMEPTFRDGDLIFIDPAAEARHGSYVVARLEDDNEATFKQLIIETGQKYLKPVNPHWPEQITPINGNCTVVGPVVFSGRIY